VSQVQDNLTWEDILAAVRNIWEVIDLEDIQELIKQLPELQSLLGLQSFQELAISQRKNLGQVLNLL
jgi:hypothetical protein